MDNAKHEHLALILVLPFIAYVLATSVIARFGNESYPMLYGAMVLVLGIALWLRLRGKRILVPHGRVGLGILCGMLGIALWIGICHLQIERQLTALLPGWLRPGERVAFNPFAELGGAQAWAFVSVRLLGIAAIVPIVEELFWRGFLLRWLIDPDWQRVPLGEYTFSSCALVTLMFTLAHPEWLAAAVYCLLINGLLYWTRDLWQCVVAHAVSNLLLVAYVLRYEAWTLW